MCLRLKGRHCRYECSARPHTVPSQSRGLRDATASPASEQARSPQYKAKAGCLALPQRLRTFETEARQTEPHRSTQPTSFGAGPGSRPSPGWKRYGLLVQRRTGRTQVLAGLDHALAHARLRQLAPRPWVVRLLAPYVTVDLQHTVVVAEHVPGDRSGERVLGVGVDVHLDDAVVDRGPDLLQSRAGSAVEDQIERSLLADLGADLVLDVLQHLGTELDRARLVHPMHVAEGQSGDVAALLTRTKHLDGPQSILNSGVELLVDLGADAVFLATDDTDLDFQDHVRG